MMAAAARSFAIRDSAYATSSRVRNPDLDILPYAFRFETFAFYSNRVWASHSIPPLIFLSSTPFPSSLITCPSTFLVIFHSSLALAFIFFFSLPSLCPRFSILVLESTGAHSRHARKISKRRIRGEDEGTYIDTHSHPFCVHYGYLQPGRKGPVYARTCERKAFRKSARRWHRWGREEGAASTRGESENLRAIAIRARVHCAKFRRKREREREIDNAIENELNAYQRSNFIFPSSGISITHVY